MSKIESYRDLIVWQKAMDLGVLIYEKTSKFPIEERFGLTLQIRKSAVSISSNIAEGYGRRSNGDYARFLNIAAGSKNECLTQSEFAFRIGYFEKSDLNEIMDLGTEIGKMLNSLIYNLSK